MASSPLDRKYRTISKHPHSPHASSDALQYRAVRTLDELKAALHLVYREYLQRGYIKANRARLRLSLFNALPSTTTFIALQGGSVVGTLSVILDSPVGLPMDEAYQSELDVLRAQGRHLAEASLLSLNTSPAKRDGLTSFDADRLMLTLHLFKTMLNYVRLFTPTTDIVGCFHPNHRSLYEFMHIEPLGGLKSYSAVNGSPAVASHFHIPSRQEMAHLYPVLKFLFDQTDAVEPLTGRLVLNEAQLHHLFVDAAPVFASASPSEMAHVQECYPAYRLSHTRPTVTNPTTHAWGLDGPLANRISFLPPEALER